MERSPQHKRVRRTPWAPLAALLLAVLASCKDSTAPHGGAASIVAVGDKIVTAPTGSSVVVEVQVVDAYGKPVINAPISFKVEQGGGSIVPSKTSSDLTGRATAMWTLGTLLGTDSDLLSAVSGTLPAIEFVHKSPAGVPFALEAVTGDNQLGFFGLPLPIRPAITAVDRLGKPAPLSVGDIGFGSYGGEFVRDTAAGIIVQMPFDWIPNETSLSDTLTVTAPGLLPAVIVAHATAAPLPSNADWAQVAAQFAAIAVDAFEHAPAPPSTFTASYMCCNSVAAVSSLFTYSPKFVTVTGQTSATLDAGGSGSISLTESITEVPFDSLGSGCLDWQGYDCDLPFTSTQALQLPSPGLTVSAVLSVTNGVVGAVQQLHLTGGLAYYSGFGTSPHSATADATIGYSAFPQQPAILTGTFGVSLNVLPLPRVTIPSRARLAARRRQL